MYCRPAVYAAPPMDAGNAELDLAGRGRDDAAHRQRALPDLAPARQLALGIRALLLELLDRGEQFFAHVHGVDRIGGLDDVVEHDLQS